MFIVFSFPLLQCSKCSNGHVEGVWLVADQHTRTQGEHMLAFPKCVCVVTAG